MKSPGLKWPGTDAPASALIRKFEMTYLLYPLVIYAALTAAIFAAAVYTL
jgi:hypothetical protein